MDFAFRADIDLTRQIGATKTLGAWAAVQPGFLFRRPHHDLSQDRWMDVIAWSGRLQARAATQRSQRVPSLAGIMALIESDSVHAGQYEKSL